MTDGDRKLIFDYCRWSSDEKFNRQFYPELDGNDILEAVKIMESKGSWVKFFRFVQKYWSKTHNNKLTKNDTISLYLLQNFFELMAAWLKERKT